MKNWIWIFFAILVLAYLSSLIFNHIHPWGGVIFFVASTILTTKYLIEKE